MGYVLYEGKQENLEIRNPVYHLIRMMAPLNKYPTVEILLGGSSRFLYHNRPPSDFDLFLYSEGGEKFFTEFMELWDCLQLEEVSMAHHTMLIIWSREKEFLPKCKWVIINLIFTMYLM